MLKNDSKSYASHQKKDSHDTADIRNTPSSLQKGTNSRTVTLDSGS